MKVFSIQNQLILYIIIPVIAGLLIIGGFSYRKMENILHHQSELEQSFVYEEIKSFISLQFVALSIIEEPMEIQMHNYSNQLIQNYFANTHGIENRDLYKLREQLGMDTQNMDIYVINTDGIVVNTTFSDDLGINFFNFGESHKQYLLNIFKEKKFDSPKFFFENKTHRYKKYSYQPTLDSEYIIELGLYSTQADKIFDYLIKHLDKIPQHNPSINAVDLYFMAGGKPYALKLNSQFIDEHLEPVVKLQNNNASTFTSIIDTSNLISYNYFYVPDSTNKIFDGTIIRMTKDASSRKDQISNEKINLILIIAITLVLILFLLIFRSRKIVRPIKRLIENAKKVENGDYSGRVSIKGRNELAELSRHFNTMIENIEKQAVERTQILESQTTKLKIFSEEQEKQNSLNKGLLLINDIMRKNKGDLNKLSDQLLSNIVKHVKALRGALYLHEKIENEYKLKLLAKYGLPKKVSVELMDPEEGLTGKCYSQGKANFIDDIPDRFFVVTSGLGKAKPKTLALIPMKIDETAIGVIEIASFKSFTDVDKEFLLKATENIASQLNIVKMNNESQILIESLKKLEGESNAKNQEMMENLEELKVMQEESSQRELKLHELLDEKG